MRLRALCAAVLLLTSAVPAQAETLGNWRVNGSISGRTFVLDCRLEQTGGTCVDSESGDRRSHPLTSFAFANNRVRWSFSTRVTLISVTLAFNGQLEGNRISGALTAAGRTGSFTAVRK